MFLSLSHSPRFSLSFSACSRDMRIDAHAKWVYFIRLMATAYGSANTLRVRAQRYTLLCSLRVCREPQLPIIEPITLCLQMDSSSSSATDNAAILYTDHLPSHSIVNILLDVFGFWRYACFFRNQIINNKIHIFFNVVRTEFGHLVLLGVSAVSIFI